MKYTGEICPYCGREFVEADDIVVCPECATPHHRACWFAHGHCANEEKHGEGFVWKKTVEDAPPQQPEQQQGEAGQSLDIVCPDCGKVSPNGTLRCPDCGALLVPFASGGVPPVAQFRPEFNPNEDIGGIKSGDIALYCRTGGRRYINVLGKRAAGRKLTVNWAAFFFAPFWFFYRKLYKPGAIFLALYLALMLWMTPLFSTLYTVYSNVGVEAQRAYDDTLNKDGSNSGAASDAYYAVIDSHASELDKAMAPVALPSALLFALNVAAALLADSFYFKKMRSDIERIRSSGTDERTIQAELFRAGGASLLIGMSSYLACDAVLYLFNYISNK